MLLQFKTFSQRIEEIEIDVYSSLNKIKSAPSEGSTFMRDCLIEFRVCDPSLCLLVSFYVFFFFNFYFGSLLLERWVRWVGSCVITGIMIFVLKHSYREAILLIVRVITIQELNTAEDFISFYEEMMPFVQTLPLVILHKETIFSQLLSRLQVKARLSVEAILRYNANLFYWIVICFFIYKKPNWSL